MINDQEQLLIQCLEEVRNDPEESENSNKLDRAIALLFALKRKLTEQELFEALIRAGVELTTEAFNIVNLIVGGSVLEISDLETAIHIDRSDPWFLRGQVDQQVAIYLASLEKDLEGLLARYSNNDMN